GSPLVADLRDCFDALARGARGAPSLLPEKTLFALENVRILGTRAQRLAAEQVVEAAEQLDRSIPQHLRRRPRRRGAIHTKGHDESRYPVGGFTAISNAGSMENLVTSELVYMDPAGAPGGFDLFDLRYAEGELLYYARDEGALLREQRVILFLLAPELTEARFKDADLPWQRVVLLLGLVRSAVGRLLRQLSQEALKVHVCFLADASGVSPLAEEQEISELLLAEWVERGVVEVCTEASAEALLARVEAGARRATVDLVYCTSGGALAGRLGSHALTLDIRSSQPWLRPSFAPGGAEGEGASLKGWADVARQLIESLL
ncbi:MAG: hypothetical protein JRH20_12115, partial [Deltaproteobacteria bacterium]|nr:hypothetical protein [Deltaproteobacteria bacterium]